MFSKCLYFVIQTVILLLFQAQFPDKPTNLVVTNIRSKSAEISWKDPDNTGDGDLTGFRIKIKKENSLILNITIPKVNKHKLNTLTPGTTYEISVSAGNKHGLGEENMISFKTSDHGGSRVQTNISSGDMKAKEGDTFSLLCSAQDELPITFSWVKDKKSLESFVEIDKPHRSSLLVVTVKEQASFGKYVCRIQDRFRSTTHTISVQKCTENVEKFAEVLADNEKIKYVIGIIALAILLVILFAKNVYLTKSLKATRENTEKKNRNNSNDINENDPEIILDDGNNERVKDEESTYTTLNDPEIILDDGNYERVRDEESTLTTLNDPEMILDDGNYEKVKDEESTYTTLNRSGMDENDDHVYTHLNEVNPYYVNQKETGL